MESDSFKAVCVLNVLLWGEFTRNVLGEHEDRCDDLSIDLEVEAFCFPLPKETEMCSRGLNSSSI